MPIKPHEAKILEAFYQLYYLTAQQVADLLYVSGSFHTVSKTLLHLADPDETYLFRGKPFDDKLVNVPYIYFLATKGRNHLEKKLGYDFSNWRTPSKMRTFIKSDHLPHCLGVNNFIILAQQFVRQYPDIKITKLLHDFTLKRLLPVAVVKPDIQINFFIPPSIDPPNGAEWCLWTEYDRNTEDQSQWRRKIKRIVELMYFGFVELFGSPPEGWTIAVVTPFGEHRVRELLLWTERQLIEMNQQELGGKFLFYALPEKPDVKEVFLDPVWESPFLDGKYSLLEL